MTTNTSGPFLGAHESVAGGLHKAFERIASVDGQALQIFTRNQRQWDAKPIEPDEAEAFKAAWEEWGHPHVVSHAGYLINLASPKADVVTKSRAALRAELERCAALGIGAVVLHPGSHGGQGADKGIAAVAQGLDETLAAVNGVDILLENTAGQGTGLGISFAELARILGSCRHPERLGICLDTCHAFAAGYGLDSQNGADAMWQEFEHELGLDKLRLMHLNDSKGELGAHKDRHEHIGQGRIGTAGFKRLLRDKRLAQLPMVLETHKDGPDKLDLDRKNLRTLRGLM